MVTHDPSLAVAFIMGIPVSILQPNGSLKLAPFEADSLAQVAQLEPEGVYTVTRTFHKDRSVLFDAHLDRLQESAQLEQIPINLNREAIRQSLRQMIQQAGNEDSRLRITVPRDNPAEILLAIEPLQLVSAEMRRTGVRVATMPITRRNPRAKTNEWIAQRMEAQQSLPPDVYEGVAVNDRGELIEGFSSNFYAIKDDRLYTVDRGMLRGIAREIVLKISEGILPIDLSAIHMQDIPSLQEAFLTSSSRGILAIIAIDDHLISQGRPGPITSELTNRYDAWVDQHLEPI